MTWEYSPSTSDLSPYQWGPGEHIASGSVWAGIAHGDQKLLIIGTFTASGAGVGGAGGYLGRKVGSNVNEVLYSTLI